MNTKKNDVLNRKSSDRRNVEIFDIASSLLSE